MGSLVGPVVGLPVGPPVGAPVVGADTTTLKEHTLRFPAESKASDFTMDASNRETMRMMKIRVVIIFIIAQVV